MDPALPSFILGYHGCDAELAESVFAGDESLKGSANDYDWLGDGIYFWEHNAQRAHDFAKAMARRPHPSGQTVKKPAVVGAIIDLGYCLNLLDSRFIAMVKQAHAVMTLAVKEAGETMPVNKGGEDLFNRKLDCAVIRTLHTVREDAGDPPFDTLRAAFTEGGRLYDNAGFHAKNHIQICVREHRSILGYFRPLNENGKPISFH